MNKKEAIIHELKKKGHRITSARKIIIHILIHANTPLTHQDIYEQVKEIDTSINLSTVYRQITFLEENSIVSCVIFKDNLARYELSIHDHHHHHLICTDCHDVQCMEICHELDEIEKKIHMRSGFTVSDHTLEFYGLCKKCSQ